jgi:hypothetical protein
LQKDTPWELGDPSLEDEGVNSNRKKLADPGFEVKNTSKAPSAPRCQLATRNPQLPSAKATLSSRLSGHPSVARHHLEVTPLNLGSPGIPMGHDGTV